MPPLLVRRCARQVAFYFRRLQDPTVSALIFHLVFGFIVRREYLAENDVMAIDTDRDVQVGCLHRGHMEREYSVMGFISLRFGCDGDYRRVSLLRVGNGGLRHEGNDGH